MCRILGVVANREADFTHCLHDGPRSFRALSREHPDGWGVAVYGESSGWAIRKEASSAFADPRFLEVAARSRGNVLVAHIRRRTVGPVSLDNTHPFQSGRWVFAHNGTIEQTAVLREGASPARLSEVRGTTDSEVFFAYLLTRLDAARVPKGPTNGSERSKLEDEVIARAVTDVAPLPGFGAINFLLSNGDTLYAFRQGRTLHVLERSVSDAPRAVLVASEQVTDEAWKPVPEGTLLKVARSPHPTVETLAAL